MSATVSWQMVGLLAMPCGSTLHSYLSAGPELLILGTEKAKCLQFCSWNDIEKKQSLMSKTNSRVFTGMAEARERLH